MGDITSGQDVDILTFPAAAATTTFYKAEDAASADGDVGVPAFAVRKATPANTSGTDGDYEALQISAGRLWVSASIDNAVAISSLAPGSTALSLGKLEDAVHSTGDLGVMALGVANEANTQFAADGDYVPLGTNREGSVRAIGSRAHDAIDADPPVKVGLKAIAHGTNPTAVAAADRTDWYANRAGVPFFIGGHPNILTLEYEVGTSAATDFKLLDVSAGTKIVVTAVDIMVSAACSVNVTARMGFGASSGASGLSTIGTAAGTPTAAQMVLSHPSIAPGSGVSKGTGTGILCIGPDGCDLYMTIGASTGGKVRALVTYFTIES